MNDDQKRGVLRHMVATVAFRARVAISEAPTEFAGFRAAYDVRSPVEILAHLGDLLIGSHHLLRGEFISLDSEALAWEDEKLRFITAVKELDGFLASEAQLAYPIEKFVQGPIGDALTHVGQLVMLRRMSGSPIREEPYFTAEIIPGKFE